jgi:hypothetical protein
MTSRFDLPRTASLCSQRTTSCARQPNKLQTKANVRVQETVPAVYNQIFLAACLRHSLSAPLRQILGHPTLCPSFARSVPPRTTASRSLISHELIRTQDEHLVTKLAARRPMQFFGRCKLIIYAPNCRFYLHPSGFRATLRTTPMVPAVNKNPADSMTRCHVQMPALPAIALDRTREMNKMAS